MYTTALIISIGTNVGLIFYIAANCALDNWERKKNAAANRNRSALHKLSPVVHRSQNEQE